MLYLGGHVLIIADHGYNNRFWTMFETWLSFQVCKWIPATIPGAQPYSPKPCTLSQEATEHGLKRQHGETSARWPTIVEIQEAEGMKDLMERMSNKTVEEARTLLSKNQIEVTNQRWLPSAFAFLSVRILIMQPALACCVDCSDKKIQLEKLQGIQERVRREWEQSEVYQEVILGLREAMEIPEQPSREHAKQLKRAIKEAHEAGVPQPTLRMAYEMLKDSEVQLLRRDKVKL